MALQITTLFLYTFLASSRFGNIEMETDGVQVRVMTTDPLGSDIYLEFAETNFIRGLRDHSISPIGFDITVLDSLLRLVYNQCLDLDDPAIENVIIKRDASPHTYSAEAISPFHIPSYVDPITNVTVPDKYIVKVTDGDQAHKFARSTGIQPFTIDLPTVACN